MVVFNGQVTTKMSYSEQSDVNVCSCQSVQHAPFVTAVCSAVGLLAVCDLLALSARTAHWSVIAVR
jgi:hypothetical protein